MKLISILPLFLYFSLGTGIKTFAQDQFAPLGAEWWYQGNSYDFTFAPPWWTPNSKWTDHAQVTGDTVINDITCRKMVLERKAKHGNNPDSTAITQTGNFYFYDNTDTVFIFNEGRSQFTPLYIFNVAVNDTICLPVPTAPANTDSNFCFVVDSIQTELFDGIPLRSFYTRTLIPEGQLLSLNWGYAIYRDIIDGGWISIGKYTEKLGGTWPLISSLFPMSSFHNVDGGIAIGFPSGNLSCYQDNEISISLSNIPCDSIPPPVSGIKKVNNLPDFITIFPNPTTDHITLLNKKNWPVNTTIQAYDILGRSVALDKAAINGDQLVYNLNGFSTGVYLLKINIDDNVFYHKILVQK